MAHKDDEFEDETPKKPKLRDDDDEIEDRPRKKVRRDDDDEEIDERPRKKARRGDDGKRSKQRKKKSNLPLILGILAAGLLLVCGGGVLGIYLLASKGKEKLLEVAEASKVPSNMKQIGLGALNYETAYGGYPTNSFDPAGKPLLSWRVHLLPFFEQEELYKQFKLNEPWDSPNNKPLLSKIPRVYLSAGEASGNVAKGTKTYFRAFSSAGAFMDPKFRKKGREGFEIGPSMPDVKDGISNTILIVESTEAVEWTKPDDLNWSGGALPPMGGDRKNPEKFLMLFADGHVGSVSKSLTSEQLKAAITIAGRENVDLP